MSARNYSSATIKTLFGSSGNQCAFPGCTSPVVKSGKTESDEVVAAYICHIYASSHAGPRGNPNLSESERNAPENLILFCGHHHTVVDKQPDEYPADKLIEWKKAHKAQFQPGTAEALKRLDQVQQNAFVQTISDREIDQEIERIRKARHIAGFDTHGAARTLAARVGKTELLGGSAEHRALALAWCARFLALGDTADEARALLKLSREIAPTVEAEIAEAFFISKTSKADALAQLAPLNSAAARSAALRIVANHDGGAEALAWAEKAGLNLLSFNADGKFFYLMTFLDLDRWEAATASAGALTEADLTECPALLQTLAMIELIQAVPEVLRELAMSQVPIEARRFPLADTPEAIAHRKKAIAYYERASEFARSVGAIEASNPASDHALWLKLRDADLHDEGIEELRASMRDDKQALRRVHLALQFGIKLDPEAIERKIDEHIALAGKATGDDAFARFALAFSKGSPLAVAEYIATHREELNAHLQKSAIVVTEIEMLARGGLIDAASKRLSEELAQGLGEREVEHLERMIAEATGADSVAERRKLYEKTGGLVDLGNLVGLLEERESWEELSPLAERLFAITNSLPDAARYALSLERTQQHSKLLNFLVSQQGLVEQSVDLKTMLAWSYWRDGQFGAASQILDTLVRNDDDVNARVLRVNLAIDSGQWHELVQYTTEEWNNREKRSPRELLATGELAEAVRAPHARDLIIEATRRAPGDPAVLVGAYSHATHAGWEQEEATAHWIVDAAALSGDDGPIKSMSLKDLIEQKPDWDKHAASIWDQLNQGKIPVAGAATMLNRSLTDFMLLASLANLNERDPRRRSVIFAYSGARPLGSFPSPKSIAIDLPGIFTLEGLGLLETFLSAYEQVVVPHSTLGWLFTERQRASFHQPSRIRDSHELKRMISTGNLRVMRTRVSPDDPLAKEVGTDLAAMLTAAESGEGSEDLRPRYVIRPCPAHRLGSLLEEEADLTRYATLLCSCHAVIEKLWSKGLLTKQEEEGALAYLKMHERRWPGEPAIADNAELFLDDVSVSYLRTVGVLERVSAAGLTAYINGSEDDEANRLLALEHFSVRELEAMEAVRKSLAKGLQEGRIRASRSTRLPDEETRPILNTAFAVLSLEQAADVLVIDDRSINRYLDMEFNGRKTPIWTTLDVINDLAQRGIISTPDFFRHKTYLRKAGYQFVTLTADELRYHLDNAPLKDGAVVETAELRAIRESFLKARMTKMLQIPLEAPWLHQTMRSVLSSIKVLWATKTNLAEAKSYSEWLLDLLDVRGWAPSALPGNERDFALFAYAAHVQSLMSAPEDVSNEVKTAYQEWVDEQVVEHMKDGLPEAFEWIVTQARAMISREADRAASTMGE